MVYFTANPNAPDKYGVTPIHLAAENGHTDVMKVLMDYTDMPNVPDNYGETPIHRAIRYDHDFKKCDNVYKDTACAFVMLLQDKAAKAIQEAKSAKEEAKIANEHVEVLKKKCAMIQKKLTHKASKRSRDEDQKEDGNSQPKKKSEFVKD